MRTFILPGVLALAARDTGGWTPVTLESLKGTPDIRYRLLENGDGLSASGDFDGDRRADRVFLVKNEAEGLYAVRLELASGRTRLLAEGDIADLPRMGLSPAAPGERRTACGKGYGDCPDHAPQTVALAHDGFHLFAYESASRLFRLEDGAIRSEWISD